MDSHIMRESSNLGVDSDLIRAVMYMETTHGWYDAAVPSEFRKSILPMNIHHEFWQDLGYSEKDLETPWVNIHVGTLLLGRITDRVDEPKSIEKIATLYNNLSADVVSNYGARVNEIYLMKPWFSE